ncbi:hypothetical protein, partial [Specibacter sp. NPDC078692]|uniref:hypothetical protein n=1 Tax=Specibacter sp. NPDC078692 TaxID=3155818 RepID=UPI00341A2234
HRGGNTQPNNQFNINKLVSIKLGTLLSSQTTTTPSQHTTNQQTIHDDQCRGNFSSLPELFQQRKSTKQ